MSRRVSRRRRSNRITIWWFWHGQFLHGYSKRDDTEETLSLPLAVIEWIADTNELVLMLHMSNLADIDLISSTVYVYV